MSLSHDDYWAKRDAVHDIVCEHFDVGSDDGLPVGDAVMDALFGPPPPVPAPEYTHGTLKMRVVDYTDVPIGLSTCEAAEATYLSPEEADALAGRLSAAATYARKRRAAASGDSERS